MSTASVARLESLLRAKKLERVAFQSFDRKPGDLAETGLTSLDELLAGGFARGHLSEIVGPRSSGRTSLLASVLSAATARGEVVALIDPCDRFDPVSGAAAGLDLSSLLWVRERGRELSRDLSQTVKRALKALGLVLDAGGFGVVVLDLADVPERAIRQIPLTTWMRVSRLLENSQTVGLLLGPEPIARSAEGQTVVLQSSSIAGRWSGTHDRNRLLQGLECQARVIRARRPCDVFITLRPEFPRPEEPKSESQRSPQIPSVTAKARTARLARSGAGRRAPASDEPGCGAEPHESKVRGEAPSS
jgi:hypothetical protein